MVSDAEIIARKLFADRGITVGNILPDVPQTHRQFQDGSECHAFVFEDGYIHFHIGTDAWKDILPPDAPEIRVRYMRHGGKEIASSEWFSC